MPEEETFYGQPLYRLVKLVDGNNADNGTLWLVLPVWRLCLMSQVAWSIVIRPLLRELDQFLNTWFDQELINFTRTPTTISSTMPPEMASYIQLVPVECSREKTVEMLSKFIRLHSGRQRTCRVVR